MLTKETTTLGVVIDLREKDALKSLLESQGSTISAFLRQKIRQYLEENKINVKTQ